MPRNHVIKKEDLPADAVEPVSIDENAFYKRRARIPRARVDLDEADALSPPDRYDYLKHGILPHEDAELDAEPYTIPAPTLDPDFPVEADEATTEAEEATDEEADDDPEAALREELEAEWQAKLEEAAAAAREEGREEGHAQGYDEGYAAAREELSETFDAEVERLAADVAQLEQLWQEFIEDSKPVLLEVAVDVAEALLDAPLPESIQGASARAIAEAVEELAGAGTLTVSLHPVDYQRLQEKGLIDQLNANHEQALHWHPDPEQPEGDWSVESPTALIRHYKAEILDTVHQLLGTSPPEKHDRQSDG